MERLPARISRGSAAAGVATGAPWRRPVARVLHNVLENWISNERVATVYGVVLMTPEDGEEPVLDERATRDARTALEGAAGPEDGSAEVRAAWSDACPRSACCDAAR